MMSSSSSSSRSSSPASRGASPGPLTPRSKIKALLATVDSSEDEDGSESHRKADTALSGVSSRKATRPSATSQSGDSSDSDVDVRPRGRLASRMQGLKGLKASSMPSVNRETVDHSSGSATLAQEDGPDQTRDVALADGEPDEDELPVLPHYLKRRTLRVTPEAEAGADRPTSPGLFVSSPARPSPARAAAQDSDTEHDLPPTRSERFKALVERKRQERIAREAAEEGFSQQDKPASELAELDSDHEYVSDIADDAGGRRLTQEVRPTRKAGKRAIEEMNRETQRLQRNMQLAHEAKTKRKITTASLFERFNYRPAGGSRQEPNTAASSSRPATPQSDGEVKPLETPPSSPPLEKKNQSVATNVETTDAAEPREDKELPPLKGVVSSVPQKGDYKDEGRAIAVPVERTDERTDIAQQQQQQPPPPPPQQDKRQIRVKMPSINTITYLLDLDEELRITSTAKARMDAVFASIPSVKTKESHSLQALRALAHIRSPGKKGRCKDEFVGMTRAQLHAQLYARARQQAKIDRESRLERLKAQGVIIQTAEEREKQMHEVEDLVARAREEARQIMQQERAQSRSESTKDPLAWDDSEDEDYQDSAHGADAEEADIEPSGSDGEVSEGEESEEETSNPVVGKEDSDTESTLSQHELMAAAQGSESGNEGRLPATKPRRARRQQAILSDDEDEAEVKSTPHENTRQATPRSAKIDSPAAPTSVLRSARKTFIPGLPVEGPAGLGLTQIFAGTMDDSPRSAEGNGPTQSMMPDFDHFPDSNFSATAEEVVMDSPEGESGGDTQGVQFKLSQSHTQGLGSLLREETNSQGSETMEPSQDVGYQEHTPLRDRFVEAPRSTVETVLAEPPGAESNSSPLVRRRRLRQKMARPGTVESLLSTAPEETHTAFSVLKEGAGRERKRERVASHYDRKKSKAKEMVEEQAEESEDEYAGLGGVDGEDSEDESVASMEQMIDDAAGNDVDENKLAAFYADRERASDEKEVERLFKDITTGMLRRKRGADYDLSDSDDGGEARRRLKRRQFAKMQKALFSDERVKKMAQLPGNQAFLRTMEDRGSADELDIVAAPAELSGGESPSQSQSGSASQSNRRGVRGVVADSQPMGPLGGSGQNRGSRLTGHAGRTSGGKKASNMREIREALWNLLEEPKGSIIPITEAGGSDSEAEDEPCPAGRIDKEHEAPKGRLAGVPVVDRLWLKRNASKAAASSSARLAFAAPRAASTTSSFRAPSLLRRATTNSLASTSSGSSSTGWAAEAPASSRNGYGEEAKIRKTAGKRSGVNSFAMEDARRDKIHETERRRQERRTKGAEKRVGVVGGLLRMGSFE